MTGPVERVPLTDEQLAKIERAYAAYPKCTTSQLLAELRASRAREQEAYGIGFEQCRRRAERAEAELSVLRPALREAKRRIGEVVREADRTEQAWLDGDNEDGPVLLCCCVRAALAGTETANSTTQEGPTT